MKTSKVTEARIAFVLKQADEGTAVADVCRKAGISEARFDNWRKLRMLTVVDTFFRFSPVIDPRFSYRGEDVVQALERSCSKVGYPKAIQVDQGSKFVSRDLALWAYQAACRPRIRSRFEND